ncbi:MAG: carbon-nitrogen hydrolase family protein [Microgenomates group bacterium]
MRIALIQFEVRIKQELKNVLRKVNVFINEAVKNKCQLICFPEDFLYGPFDYYQKNEIDKILRNNQTVIKFFSKKAKDKNIHIIAGTTIRRFKDKLFNSCLVFDKKGKIVYVHNKQKLVPYGFEKKNITSGINKIKPFVISGTKCGVLICRELFYPSLFQKLRKQGVEIIFIPAFWSKRSNDYLNHKLNNRFNFSTEARAVDILCQARSVENEVCLCFVNACGNLKDENNFDVLLGRTQVCYPFYGSIKKLNQNKEEMIIFEYNKSLVDDARKAYQIFKN